MKASEVTNKIEEFKKTDGRVNNGGARTGAGKKPASVKSEPEKKAKAVSPEAFNSLQTAVEFIAVMGADALSLKFPGQYSPTAEEKQYIKTTAWNLAKKHSEGLLGHSEEVAFAVAVIAPYLRGRLNLPKVEIDLSKTIQQLKPAGIPLVENIDKPFIEENGKTGSEVIAEIASDGTDSK